MMSFVPITPNNHTHKHHGNTDAPKINKITHNKWIADWHQYRKPYLFLLLSLVLWFHVLSWGILSLLSFLTQLILPLPYSSYYDMSIVLDTQYMLENTKYKFGSPTKYIFGFWKGMFLYPYCIQILIRMWFLRRWRHHVLDIQTIPWIFNIIASKTCQGIAHNNAFFRSHYYCMSSLSEKYLPLVVSNNLFPIMIYNSSHMKG